jgi:hypothetical protein
MNQPVLIGFGDSWAVGDDLNPGEKHYLQLAAEQFQIPWINFAVGSSSVPHLIVQFKNFIDTKYFPKNHYHAVFFLTAQERSFYYDQDTKELQHLCPSSNPTNPYYRNYNRELGNFTLNTTILALQQLCSIYSVQDYYMLGWQTNPLWAEVDHTKIWKSGKFPITQTFHGTDNQHDLSTLHGHGPNGQRNECFDRGLFHPNQLGHRRIAQSLCEWIKIE